MDPMTGPSKVSELDIYAPIEPAIYANLFLETLSEEGIDPRIAIKGTELSVSYLANPANRISLAQQIKIYENIGQLRDCTRLALLHGSRIQPHHHGSWGYAIRSSATVRDALCNFNTYFNVIGPIAMMALVEEKDVARWVAVNVITSGPARRVAIAEMLGGNLALMKRTTKGAFELRELWLDDVSESELPYYQDYFSCPVRHGMDSIEMRFDPQLLSLKMPYADSETEAECVEMCRRQIARIDSYTGVSGATRRLIREKIADSITLEEVASELNLSGRSLRRKLRQEGSSFTEIRDETRLTIAKNYLTESSISIDEIAFVLGYVEPSNFRHAFKKWTGHAPGIYRRALSNASTNRKV